MLQFLAPKISLASYATVQNKKTKKKGKQSFSFTTNVGVTPA